MTSSKLLQSNLQSLRRKYPEYADVLSAIPENGRYSFEPAGSAIGCRDVTGAWIHGPRDPWEQASEELETLIALEPTLYVLLRPGLGYLSLSILGALRGTRSVVLVAEDRLDLFKATLSRVDWTSLFGSANGVLLLGDLPTVVRGFLDRHPALSILPMSLIVPPDLAASPGIESLSGDLVTYSERTQAAIEADLSVTGTLIGQRRDRNGPVRVLLTVPEIGYLADPIARGFRECGAEVVLQAEERRSVRVVQGYDWITEISRYAPDLVLWMNRPELSPVACHALRQLGIQNVHWSIDSPRRMQLNRADFELIDAHFCFDATYLKGEAVGRARYQAQLSLGAGLEPLKGRGTDDIRWPARVGPQIGFVGALGDARVADLRAQLLRIEPGLLAVLDEIATAEGNAAEAFERAVGRPYEGAPCLYIDEMRTARRRRDILSALPHGALRVFGGIEWLRAGGPLGACYAGHTVQYGADLASLYYDTLVNVNVFHEQCVDSTNSRVYDVLAVGGFLMTEYKPCLEQEFEIGRHLVVFRTPEEAREQALYYLDHRTEREEIARAGQRHVLAHHNFSTRCARILELGARPKKP